jgi:hypothetical protein
MLPELFDANKSLLLFPQVQVNNQVNNHSITDRSMTTPCNKHLRHQLPLSSDASIINIAPNRIRAKDLLRDFERDGLEFTTLFKPTLELHLLP